MRLVKTRIVVLLYLALRLTVDAQTTEQEWQQEAMRRYPALAVRGSPLNNKFVAEYQRRKNSPPEAQFFANPKWPILLADQCAGSLSTPTPPASPPPPATAKPDSPADAESSNLIIYVLAGATVIGLLVISSLRWKRRVARRSPDWVVSSGFGGLAAFAAIVIGFLLLNHFFPETPHDRGYARGSADGRDFANSHENVSPENAVVGYIALDRTPGYETDEYRKAYREGFKKGYEKTLSDSLYR